MMSYAKTIHRCLAIILMIPLMWNGSPLFASAGVPCVLLNRELATFVHPFRTVLHVESADPLKSDAAVFQELLAEFNTWIGAKHPSIRPALEAARSTGFATGGNWEGFESASGISVGVQTVASLGENGTPQETPDQWGLMFRHTCDVKARCPEMIWETEIVINRAPTRGFDVVVNVRHGFLKGDEKDYKLDAMRTGTPNAIKNIINNTDKYRVTTGSDPIVMSVQNIKPRGVGDFYSHVIKAVNEPTHLPVVLLVADPYTGKYPIRPDMFGKEFAGRALIFTAGPDVHDELVEFAGTRVKKNQGAVIVYIRDAVAYYSARQFEHSQNAAYAGLYSLMNRAVTFGERVYRNTEQIHELNSTRLPLPVMPTQPVFKAPEDAYPAVAQAHELEELRQLREANRELQKELADFAQQRNYLANQKRKLLEERTELQRQLGDMGLDLEIARTEVKSVTSTMSEMQEQIAELTDQINAMKAQMHMLKRGDTSGERREALLRDLTAVPTECSEVVEIIEHQFKDNILFTENAKKLAANADRKHVPELWMALVQLATTYPEVRQLLAQKKLRGNFDDNFVKAMQAKDVTLDYTSKENKETMSRFAASRLDNHPEIGDFHAWEHIKGRRYGHDEHFRLYFYWDAKSKRIVVSSLPDHLETLGTYR